MSARRLVAPELRGYVAAPPPAPAQIEWVAPGDLYVDARYQRNLSERSLRLIRKIATEFSWAHFKVPNASRNEEGQLELTDGQHSALGALVRGVPLIPVMISESDAVAERAESFLALNRDRVAMTLGQIFHAGLAAEDPTATAVMAAAAAAGVRILKYQPGAQSGWKPNDTMAIGALSTLYRDLGASAVARVLRVLAAAGLAPITTEHVRAVRALLYLEEYAGAFAEEDLSRVLRTTAAEALKEAKLLALANNAPHWKMLAIYLFRQLPKRRGGARPAPAPVTAAPPAATPAPVATVGLRKATLGSAETPAGVGGTMTLAEACRYLEECSGASTNRMGRGVFVNGVFHTPEQVIVKVNRVRERLNAQPVRLAS